MAKAVVEVKRSLPVWNGLDVGIASDGGVDEDDDDDDDDDDDEAGAGFIWVTSEYRPFSDRKSYRENKPFPTIYQPRPARISRRKDSPGSRWNSSSPLRRPRRSSCY